MHRQRLGEAQTLHKADQFLVNPCAKSTTFAERLTHEEPMNLVPIRPPGPNARKARAFAMEIVQLRAQGYTFEAIREALAAAGVHVSNSTVQREVARAARHKVSAASAVVVGSPDVRPAPPSPAPAALGPAEPVQGTSARADGPSGRDVAEAFTRNLITNPFLRAKKERR